MLPQCKPLPRGPVSHIASAKASGSPRALAHSGAWTKQDTRRSPKPHLPKMQWGGKAIIRKDRENSFHYQSEVQAQGPGSPEAKQMPLSISATQPTLYANTSSCPGRQAADVTVYRRSSLSLLVTGHPKMHTHSGGRTACLGPLPEDQMPRELGRRPVLHRCPLTNPQHL